MFCCVSMLSYSSSALIKLPFCQNLLVCFFFFGSGKTAANPFLNFIQKALSDITDTTPIFLYSLWYHPISAKEPDEVAGHWQGEAFVFWCGDPTSVALQNTLAKQGHFPAVMLGLNYVIFKDNPIRHGFNWT